MQIEYGLFHQCTGEILEPSAKVRSLLFALKLGTQFSFADEDLERLGDDGRQIRQLIEKEFLIVAGQDPLASFLDHYVVRPIQNPAVAYRSPAGETFLVRTSMGQRIFSPGIGELPKVIEEQLGTLTAELFLAADGTKTLNEIFAASASAAGEDSLKDPQFREAVEFLTRPHRQLIKFTRDIAEVSDPYSPCNIVPRNMYGSAKSARGKSEGVVDFHLLGIEDASWEFDLIEPTINHGFRFASEALGGLAYGARFCVATMRPDVLPLHGKTDRLEVLEVGGGTGSFAKSFIEQAQILQADSPNAGAIHYHIVDLSPVLSESQRQQVSALAASVQHFHQDATELNIPGRKFDLIIANEVIADFPVASVTRQLNTETNESEWSGSGEPYLKKYGLADEGAPDHFLLNTGTFQFVERAWEHLAPGGTLIVTEYGGEAEYPAQAHHLNHEEFSINFGHVKKCAEQIGFNCRLQTLKDFLKIDDQIMMLDGQEEQIMCLNHIFGKFDQRLPFALISEREFKERFQQLAERIGLTGVTFSPFRNGFHFGPNLKQFLVLLMTKPDQDKEMNRTNVDT